MSIEHVIEAASLLVFIYVAYQFYSSLNWHLFKRHGMSRQIFDLVGALVILWIALVSGNTILGWLGFGLTSLQKYLIHVCMFVLLFTLAAWIAYTRMKARLSSIWSVVVFPTIAVFGLEGLHSIGAIKSGILGFLRALKPVV